MHVWILKSSLSAACEGGEEGQKKKCTERRWPAFEVCFWSVWMYLRLKPLIRCLCSIVVCLKACVTVRGASMVRLETCVGMVRLEAWVTVGGMSWGARTIHSNTLQHTAKHYKELQHTATHCNTSQHTATQWCGRHVIMAVGTEQYTATHCNTLPRTATHCNTLQHTGVKGVSQFA